MITYFCICWPDSLICSMFFCMYLGPALCSMGANLLWFLSLWQGSMPSSSSAKLVDCILALKSFHEWKQGGALGFWRLKSPNHVTGNSTNSKFVRSRSMNSSSNSRKKWAPQDQESNDDSSSASLSNEPSSFEAVSSVSSHDALPNIASAETRSSGADREVTSYVKSSTGAGSNRIHLLFGLK